MKTVIRFVVFVLLASFILPLAAVNAQEGEGTLSAIPDVSAVYYLSATGGSFADQGDGTYLLTLEGVAPDMTWISVSPSLSIQHHGTADLSTQWAAAEGLTTDAVIEAAGLSISMSLAAPTYDEVSGVQTFVATVTNIAAPAGVKEAEVPATFEAADMSIAWSTDFQAGLIAGIEAIYSGLRASTAECDEARVKWNEYLAWWQPKQAELTAAIMTCRGWDGTTDKAVKQAACATAQSLQAEIAVKSAEATPYIQLLNTEC